VKQLKIPSFIDINDRVRKQPNWFTLGSFFKIFGACIPESVVVEVA
jgi:hypothetical protein